MVGISPGGAIIYISSMYGGRASDKCMTQESDDLLQSLNPGDKVMVDRGFTIREDLPSGVELINPAFKPKSGQFRPQELRISEKIAKARIHVERAMKVSKQNHLLHAAQIMLPK